MAKCPPFDPLGPYVSGLADFVDCHARLLAEEGYQALAGGPLIAAVLNGFVAIFVALVGYRMLLGEPLNARGGVAAAVRIGLVVSLATQWPAYQVLAYNVAIEGPAEIGGYVLATSALGGDDRPRITARLDGVHASIDALLHPDPAAAVQRNGSGQPTDRQVRGPAQPASLAVPVTSPGLLTATDLILMSSSLAGLLAVRIAAALLLALGPLFIACLLFDTLRGFFVSWVRALTATIVGAVAVPAVLALELAAIEPQILELQHSVASAAPVPILSVETLATASLFALVLVAALAMSARAASGFRLDAVLRLPGTEQVLRAALPERQSAFVRRDGWRAGIPQRNEAPSLAQSTAHIIQSIERRDLLALSHGSSIGSVGQRSAASDEANEINVLSRPLGSRFRRAGRGSASAERRAQR